MLVAAAASCPAAAIAVTAAAEELHDLAHDAEVTLQIFDVTGKLVRTLVNGPQLADHYTVEWDGTTDAGTAVSSGVFWVRMSTARGFRASTKMVVLK